MEMHGLAYTAKPESGFANDGELATKIQAARDALTCDCDHKNISHGYGDDSVTPWRGGFGGISGSETFGGAGGEVWDLSCVCGCYPTPRAYPVRNNSGPFIPHAAYTLPPRDVCVSRHTPPLHIRYQTNPAYPLHLP